MINTNNIYKYIILFTVVSLSTYMIPNCSIMNHHAFYRFISKYNIYNS